MKHAATFGVWAFVLCLAAARSVSAEPVTITAGSLVITGLAEVGSVSITGTRGFSLEGGVLPLEGNVVPVNECGSPGCVPGFRLDMSSTLGGAAFDGVATLDGATYDDISSINSPAGAFLEFAAAATLPPLGTTETLLTAPFTLRGFFSVPFPLETAILRGRGTATVRLLPIPPLEGLPQGWFVDELRYDFEPVPEPGTLLLAASGMFALLRKRFRSSTP